jgi:predicted transposase YdaD
MRHFELHPYEAYLQRLMKLAGYRETEMTDAIDLIQQGKEEKEIEAVIGFNRIGIERTKIAEALGITEEKVNQIIENQPNK